MGSSHLIRGVMQWELRWCWRMWVWEKMVPKCELPKSIPLYAQGLNCGTNIRELEDHVGEKGLSLNWLTKLGLVKKNSSCKFSHWFVRKCLSQIYISPCFIAWPWGSKVKHHWGNKRSKCKVGTLYRYCTSLSNGKQNVTCTSHHRPARMQLYKRRWQRPKWKDSRTSNVQTQVQADVGRVGVREGIGLGWSQGFGLDECWWQLLSSISKLAPICGAQDFRWKLRACWRNGGRLGGMIMANCKDQ